MTLPTTSLPTAPEKLLPDLTLVEAFAGNEGDWLEFQLPDGTALFRIQCKARSRVNVEAKLRGRFVKGRSQRLGRRRPD